MTRLAQKFEQTSEMTMKHIIIFVITAVLLTIVPQNANGQFLKKLGKVLETVDKALGIDAGQTQPTDTGKGEGDVKVSNKLTGFSVEYKGVAWQKDFCGVEFVITNKGSKTERIYYFDKLKAYGADGKEYACRSIVGNAVTSLGNGDFDFEPGIPVKCVFAVFDVPKSGTKMGLCQLRIQAHNPQQGYQDRFIEFRDVVLPPRPVETAGQPFKGVWTIKGKGMEGKLTLDLYGKSIEGMDAEGKSIKCYGLIYVGYGSGSGIQVDECSIISRQTNGNKATVRYIGGRDGNTYESVLTLDPTTGKITVSGTKTVVEEGMQNGFVTDGLVFSK